MKPFLVLQLRPEAEAADNEYEAILKEAQLQENETRRVRLEQESLPDDLRLRDYAGVIVGGGPGCVSDDETMKSPIEKKMEDAVMGLMPEITATDFPFLGCCYGIGILGRHLGGRVSKEQYGEEIGAVECAVTPAGRDDRLLNGFPERFMAFTGHKEALQELPADCAHLLASAPCPFQMVRHKNNVYATQFHPEANSDVFELRIRVYNDYGYFEPHEADRLTAQCRAADVHAPGRILKNFVDAYRSGP
ncbi:MAG: glutamine amidotransferase [Hyphococcus sp.]